MSNESSVLTEGALVDRVPVALTIVHDEKAPGHGYVRPGERLSHDLPGLDELLAHGSAEMRPRSEAAEPSGDPIRWVANVRVEKYNDRESGDSERRAAHPDIAPDDVHESESNLLVIGGASALWECLIGNGVGTSGNTLAFYSNANAFLGVGDSTTAAADTQTNLQAVTNALRKAMDASNPAHTDSTGTSGAKTITFKSTFGTTDANFAWQEWGVFNGAGTGSPPTGSRMLNRKVESLGTKTSSATWVLTITLSLA